MYFFLAGLNKIEIKQVRNKCKKIFQNTFQGKERVQNSAGRVFIATVWNVFIFPIMYMYTNCLKISKRQSETVNRRMKDNTMSKRLRANNVIAVYPSKQYCPKPSDFPRNICIHVYF